MSFRRKLYNFLISLAIIAFAPICSHAQTTVTVTGHLATIFGSPLPGGTGGNAYKVCLSLRTGDNQIVTNARIVGGGGTIVNASNGNANCVTPDASGFFTFNAVPNDLVETLGTTGGTQWQIYFQKGNSFITGSNYVFLLADGSENLDVKAPNTIVPIVPAPTGDTTYLRTDGGNAPVSLRLIPTALSLSSLTASLQSSSGAGGMVTGVPSFIDMSNGVLGQGGMVQSTNDASNVTGYGEWLTNNAYWNGTNWIQVRGVGTSSSGFTVNHHKGFSFNRAAPNGTNNTAITWTEVANIDSTGLLTLGNVARTATGGPTAPAYSFTAETNSGWFRQQAGIFGFSVGGNYIAQYTATRIGLLPGLSLGWAPGAPNSFSDDVNLSRVSAGVLGVGTGSPGSTAGTLFAGNISAKTTNTVQNVAKYATGGAGTSVSPWTSASGTGGCQEAVNSCGANGCTVNFTEGFYSFTNTTTGCVAADNITFDSVGRSAIIQAGANNAVFFSDSTHAFFSRFLNLTLDGNTFTGVKAFDLTNARYGTVIQNVNVNNLNQGIVSTNGNFGLTVKNVSFRAVTAPINVVANSSSILFDYVTIDNENFAPTVGCTNGMNFQSGTGSNLGPMVLGGFIQGCATGLLDQTIGLTVIGTYFEDNTVADISCSGGSDSHYIHTNHWGAIGPVAIKGRNCTGVIIDHPLMGSGARTGLFDWDGTNTASTAKYVIDAGFKNTNQGTITGLTGSENILGKLSINGDTLLQSSPRFTLGGFMPTMNTNFRVSQFTPDKPVTLISIDAVATVIEACTVAPTITVTNGTFTQTLTLTTGTGNWTTGAITQSFPAGTQIVIFSATTGTCTNAPVNLNVTAQFKMG